MQEDQDASNKTQEPKQKDRVREFLSRPEITGISIAVWLFVAGFFLVRLYVGDHIPTDPDRTTVLMESMFALALVVIAIVQSGIYFKQAKALDAQLEISSTQLVVSNQAYVGIHSIADHETKRGKVILIKIENIGRVPADEIRIEGRFNGFLMNRDIVHPDVRPDFADEFNEYFGRTKLFRGNLKLEILLPYAKYVSRPERNLIDDGVIAFYAWGTIGYNDGFGKGKTTEFSFFHSRTGQWLVAAPWSPNVIQLYDDFRRDMPREQKAEA